MFKHNFVNKTALSFAAISVLASSLSADINLGEISQEDDGTALSKDGGIIRLFKVEISNDGSDYATLIELNLTISSNENNISFLKNFVLAKNADATKVAEGSSALLIQDDNTSSAVSIEKIVDLSEVDDQGLKFLDSEGNANYIVSLNYDQIVGIANGELNVTLNSITVKDENNESKKLDISKTVSSLRIDAVAPEFGDTNDSSKDAVTQDTDLSDGFTVDINFTENIADPSDDLTGLNSAFAITDGLGNDIKIIDASYSTDKKVLTLELNNSVPNNDSVIGDVTLAYSGDSGLLQDLAGNTVADLEARIIYDDTIVPTLESVQIDFEDSKSGQITFSEPIQVDNISTFQAQGVNVVNDNDNQEVQILNLKEVSTDKNAKTVLSFETNVTVGSGFSITFLNNTIVKDFGGNENNESSELTATFTAGDLSGMEIEANKWNLIALPSNKLTTSRYMQQTGAVQTIWGYENSTWVKFPTVLKAGQGYWVKGSVNTEGFDKTPTTGFNAVKVDSSTVIKENSSDEWQLLGINSELSWKDAYSQIQDGCSGVSIFSYDAANNSWNTATNIPAHSGIWVKQENCSK